MPFDTLKMDHIFFGDTLYSKLREILIRPIMAMADHRFQIVQEGVETEAQLEFLRDTNCTAAGRPVRPMPVSDFVRDFLTGPAAV